MQARFSLAASTALILAATLAPSLAHASDSAPEPAPAAAPARPAADNLGQARTLIAARQWSAALDELHRVNDAGSADWNNLMGFTLRKGKTPDLAGSEKYYDAALRIDPHHRNTLEYSGELYLMKGDLPKAQARLAALSTECGANCEQYGQLKSAIERYKAAGDKYVSTGW
ncbi:MAG: tetratricopeptide repeat protein [Burkholderiaceae bacterium]